jgi:alkylation response protein AidB-like acyl-CoA dehydrogenase
MMDAPDQNALIVDAREFAASYVRPNAGVWERQKAMPLEAFHRAAAIGLTAIEIPEGLGGRGCSFSVKAQVAGILAEADFGAAMALINTHNVGAKLARLAAPHALHRYVPDLVSGQRIGCTALTEADAGSDVTAMQTHAKRSGDGWLLNGEKVWITNAAIADTIIVYAQTKAVGDASGIGAFLIDAQRAGFERGAISEVNSLFSTGCGSFRLIDYRLDESEVVAAPGRAFKSIMTEINGARIYVAAMCCGMMRSALALLGDFGNRRESFGSKLADHQGWRWILAEAASELAAVDALVDSAARALDAGDDVQLIASQTKIAATRMVERHLPALCHAMGAEGLRQTSGLDRHLMGMRFAGLVDGSTEMLLERVARLLRPR